MSTKNIDLLRILWYEVWSMVNTDVHGNVPRV